MSGLFKRLSGRRSAGPEGSEPPTAAEHGTADAPATPPAEPERPSVPAHGPGRSDARPARGRAARARPERARPTRTPHTSRRSGARTPLPRRSYGPEAPPPVYGPPARRRSTARRRTRTLRRPSPRRSRPSCGSSRSPTCPRGLTPTSSPPRPATSARRGKLRRRIAFLRAARELLLRDLGGFIYELHRTAHDIEHEAHRRLRETKLARLSRVDAELHELEIPPRRRPPPGAGARARRRRRVPALRRAVRQLRALLLQLRQPADRVRASRARQGPGALRPSRAPSRSTAAAPPAARRSTSRRRRSARSTRAPERRARLPVAEP